MSDSEEKETKDSRTINIEISAGGLEGMFRMMAGRRDTDRTGSGCCESSRAKCCPQTGEANKQEFKIVINRKEN
jgi:hypothetical protein